MDKKARKNRLNMAVSLYEKGAAAARDAMLPKLMTEPSKQEHPKLVDTLSMVMESMPAEGLVHACLAMAFREDSVDLLSSIAVPTLVIAGEQDPIAPPDVMKKMADQIHRRHLSCHTGCFTFDADGETGSLQCAAD